MREFLSLSETPEITVEELCARADVARKTFYNHYQGINQVQMELVAEFVAMDIECRQYADNCAEGFEERFIRYVGKVIDMLSVDADLYTRNIFKIGMYAYFQQTAESAAIIQMLRQMFFEDWLGEEVETVKFSPPIPLPAFIEFYFSMQSTATVKTAFVKDHSFRGDVINANDLLLRYFLRNISDQKL